MFKLDWVGVGRLVFSLMFGGVIAVMIWFCLGVFDCFCLCFWLIWVFDLGFSVCL